MQGGSISMNTQGGVGMQTGGGLTINASDSINESIFGLLPMTSLGYARKTDATLGKIGFDSKDGLLSGGIEMKLGFPITQGSITLLPPGEIILDSFASTITAKTLLSPGLFVGYGDASLAGLMSSLELSLAGGIKASGLMSTLNLAVSGAAQMEGLLGEVTVGTSGKVLVKGLMA